MFESLEDAFMWAKVKYPGCSFSVKEQPDGPTIVSVKNKGTKEIRVVVYVRKESAGADIQS